MRFPIAILQGRLSPSQERRFQFFPREWELEFLIASAMGFDGIEWLCDVPEMESHSNPVLQQRGVAAIKKAQQRSAMPVVSVCADWFMKYDLRDSNGVRTLPWLVEVIRFAATTRNRTVLIPLLEGVAPRDDRDLRAVRENLQLVVPILENHGVSIAFETELSARVLEGFVDSFQSPNVGVYYDIGNCTSYGFDCPRDIRNLGHRVKGVHVKDRRLGSTQSVILGQGDADIRGCLTALDEIRWSGTLVLQAFRDSATYVKDAQVQLAYMLALQKEVFGNG